MPSINLMFHLSSALILGLLIWYLLRLQLKLRWQQRLWSCFRSHSKLVMLAEPADFLRKLSEAFGIEHEVSCGEMPLQKIEWDTWARAHVALGFQRLECSETAVCRLRVSRMVDLESWKSQLEASLKNKVQIEWDLSGKE